MSASRARVAVHALAVGALLACKSSTPPIMSPGTPVTPTAWTQIWSDEFDGPAGARVDSTKWRYDLQDGCSQGNCGWGNNEKEYYSDASSNVALNGQGQLMIVARVASSGLACYYGACRYTSGKITTRGKFTSPPGRVEARIKLPTGQGLWPAFWMLGDESPPKPWPACGELDIMENKGSDSSSTSSAIHGPGYSGNTPFARLNRFADGSFSTTYHTYAVEWDSLHVWFYVDSIAHYQASRAALEQRGSSVLGRPYFLLLNLAVGGHFDGDPGSDAIFPATMLVDYVRVFRLDTSSSR